MSSASSVDNKKATGKLTPPPDEEELKKMRENGVVFEDRTKEARAIGASMLPDNKKPAVKFDAGKYRFSLLPADALEKVAEVGTYGAKKYGDGNWLNGGGMAWSRLYDACIRHLFAFKSGEVMDKESA